MTPDYWEEACRVLARRDPILRKIIKTYPGISLRHRGAPFMTLARAIVGQQISVKAAQSVWLRVVALVGKIEPVNVLAVTLVQLRLCGLSQRKCEYILDLAAHFENGRLKPRTWNKLDDETLIELLSEVKGIGRWTAEMFLMFNLLRPNVLPVDDIGLQRAMAIHYNGEEKLAFDEMRAVAAKWQPWRSVATWYLWRSLDPIPVEY